MKNIAVILASGTGSRFGSNIPKQFVKLAGKPIIAYTVSAFQSNNKIDEIIIVTLNEYVDLVNEIVIDERFSKVSKVICGGNERYLSSWSAINTIDGDDTNVLFHDAVRPFVSQRIIDECVDALSFCNAVDVVADPTDTIVKVKNNTIMSIPDRRFLGRGQTPQAFKLKTIRDAYEKFIHSDNHFVSDDCGIVMRFMPQEPIFTVKGEERNFKLTHQQDIYLADHLIQDGLHEYHRHSEEEIERKLNDKVIVIFGGSSGIGESIALKAKTLGANVYSFSRANGGDVTDLSQIQASLLKVIGIEGRIDGVINCAAILVKKPLSFMAQKEIDDSIHVNYSGTVNVAREAYAYLKESKGFLVNFASSSFSKGRATYSIYSSTKAAVVNFTQAIAEEWMSDDINVFCINPERADTPMRRKNFGIEPEGTLLKAEDIASATLSILMSEMTGLVITLKK
ncbi:bifunctional cytidylyltransferase/SDR family oxidoreductase [Vibrio parahaemolyticus]|nr:bifunctional cytidylyltransferase/SDR family oxidoreductase [Vibrio parahaemolyticus]MDF5071170.1 bifunctional cytidylyltransferase/SDR family oxidoreductase [Vibrio parahaemolyticus]MDF5303934.1 bifunctional cytidylyltransferase/SDR family oxidoreductase [Vibrio parahaemolyticus]